MAGLYPSPGAPPEYRENLRVQTERHSEALDQFELLATNGEPDGAVAVRAPGGGIGPAGFIAPAVLFPDAANGVCRWVKGVRGSWEKRTLRITWYYTSTVGGVAAFKITWAARAYANTGNMNTAVDVGTSAVLLLPGPTNAYDVLTATVLLNTAAFSSRWHRWLRLTCSRDGATDANNNEYYHLYGLAEALPG